MNTVNTIFWKIEIIKISNSDTKWSHKPQTLHSLYNFTQDCMQHSNDFVNCFILSESSNFHLHVYPYRKKINPTSKPALRFYSNAINISNSSFSFHKNYTLWVKTLCTPLVKLEKLFLYTKNTYLKTANWWGILLDFQRQ